MKQGDIDGLSFEAALAAAEAGEVIEMVPGIADPFKRA